MKHIILVLLFLAVAVTASVASELAVSRLNSDLVPIYERLVADGPGATLVGRQLELSLTLKHASDRFLLFNDTQVVLDKNTSYYLIKWKYEPEDIEALVGQTNVVCEVRGEIVDVVAGARASGMPYIIVELISAELRQN